MKGKHKLLDNVHANDDCPAHVPEQGCAQTEKKLWFVEVHSHAVSQIMDLHELISFTNDFVIHR